MNTGSSTDKKERILDLFRNHNVLRSADEFFQVEYKLHFVCREGGLELIKILLSETIENDSKDFLFKIDKTNKAASLFKVNQKLEHLNIPRTVQHNMNEYLVTSISNIKSKIKTIEFEEDSAIKTIYGNSFNDSDVEEIYLPKSLTELKD